MAVPTGEIIARPMVKRACGCEQEFQHYAVDKYRAQRLAKFQKTRCTNCVAKLVEEQRAAAALLPSKGEAFQLLPADTTISMARQPDGTWAGKLSGAKQSVDAISDGPQGLVVALARKWVSVSGTKPADPPAAPAPAPTPAPKFAPPKPPPPKAK